MKRIIKSKTSFYGKTASQLKEEIRQEETSPRIRVKKPNKNITVDEEIVVSAVQQGFPLWKSAQMAGSKAKTKESLKQVAYSVLKLRKTGSSAFIEKLKSKQDMILNAMTSEKAESETFRSLAQALGIINERMRLVEGKSTENKAVVIRWDDGTSTIADNSEPVQIDEQKEDSQINQNPRCSSNGGVV